MVCRENQVLKDRTPLFPFLLPEGWNCVPNAKLFVPTLGTKALEGLFPASEPSK